MITLFIFVALIICFCAIIKSLKPDKKNIDKIEEEASSIPFFEMTAKPMTTAYKILNLSFTGNNEVQYFAFNNGYITVRTKSGKEIFGHISELTVKFDQTSPNPKNPLKVIIKCNKNKLEIYEMSQIFTDEEWKQIFETLSLAHKTYGVNYFKNREKNIKSYRINSAINAISKI